MTSIGYVVSRWGAPTQTFVRREAEAVAALGLDVTALSLRRPAPTDLPVPVTYLTPGRVLLHAAIAVAARPGRSLRILGSVVRRTRPRLLPAQLWASLVGLAWAQRGLLRNRSPHAHFGWVAATAAWAGASWEGVPYTVVLHAFELHTTRLHDRFTAVPLRAALRCFVISSRDRGIVAERWGVDATILHMGVPEAWLEAQYSAVVEHDVIVAVGSLVEKKGHAVLLEAVARCPVPFRLEILGAGPLEAELLALRDELGLADRVELLGAVPENEVRRRVRRAWVCALAAIEARSGDRDGIPVALMEAMALGTPVVTTRVGGIPELVDGAGLLVAPGDPGAMADALALVREPSVRSQLSELGRGRIAEDWTVERSARLVAEVHGVVVG